MKLSPADDRLLRDLGAAVDGEPIDRAITCLISAVGTLLARNATSEQHLEEGIELAHRYLCYAATSSFNRRNRDDVH